MNKCFEVGDIEGEDLYFPLTMWTQHGSLKKEVPQELGSGLTGPGVKSWEQARKGARKEMTRKERVRIVNAKLFFMSRKHVLEGIVGDSRLSNHCNSIHIHTLFFFLFCY
jgi:hypothetical protein